MITQNIEIYEAQLMTLEAGVMVEKPSYATLREAYEQNIERGLNELALTPFGTEPTLYGLPLTAVRRMWRDYYGIRNTEPMGVESLRVLSYDDWHLALQRACWFPLTCEKMPYQKLSNMVADCCLFYGDPRVVLRQLMDMLEQLRQMFSPRVQPLEPSDVMTHAITRHLYCQIKSKPVCNDVVRQLAELRSEHIRTAAESNGEWAKEAEKMIMRTTRISFVNSY